jgi:predicted  nucleic acid-binding Zn-ribbon protein
LHPDLERLIRLQELDTRAEQARHDIAAIPERVQALETRLAERRDALAAARQSLSDAQTARRALEKDLAVVQTRLSRFKDQLMEVRTNKEYTAMQKEIATAEQEVRSFEDRILERMLEGDELSAAVKAAEKALSAEEQGVANERASLDRGKTALEEEVDAVVGRRAALAAETPRDVLDRFERVVRQRGVAVAEARGGHCTICHVRLRPQMFNEIRRNDAIIQCESCNRILYFVAPSEGAAAHGA